MNNQTAPAWAAAISSAATVSTVALAMIFGKAIHARKAEAQQKSDTTLTNARQALANSAAGAEILREETIETAPYARLDIAPARKTYAAYVAGKSSECHTDREKLAADLREPASDSVRQQDTQILKNACQPE